ncbi:MAG TPA: hypothetical protein VKE41_01930, partial [Roseiflexaceae bacterium]|nr:hypothetical protein [Roseiflexaceae bacterium]
AGPALRGHRPWIHLINLPFFYADLFDFPVQSVRDQGGRMMSFDAQTFWRGEYDHNAALRAELLTICGVAR